MRCFILLIGDGEVRAMKRGIGRLLTVLGLLLAGMPASAHHSVQAQFDLNKPFTITGVVTKVEWINPHSYLYLDVKDDSGTVKRWAFEMAGPGALRRAGLSRADRGHHHCEWSARQRRNRFRAHQGLDTSRWP
jgi:hypothetical protein